MSDALRDQARRAGLDYAAWTGGMDDSPLSGEWAYGLLPRDVIGLFGEQLNAMTFHDDYERLELEDTLVEEWLTGYESYAELLIKD